jgi:D-3-phosphoglycerate dehydrogenase
MFKIQTKNNISAKGLALLERDNFEVASEIVNPDGIIVRSADLHQEEFASNLLAIARAGAGVNNIPIDKCANQGIVVFNTPGANAQAVMELTLSGMLMASRNLLPAVEYTKNLSDLEKTELKKQVESGKKKFKGQELSQKTIGIIGLGQIGCKVAVMAHALGMDVIGYDPFLTPKAALKLPRDIQLFDSLESLISKSDFITIHVALNDETRGMVSAEYLKKAPPNMMIMNFARGEIVDETAVMEAIKNERLGAYVTDFPSPQLLKSELPQIISLPHLGASTMEAEDNCAIMASDQIKDFLQNGNIVNSVNFPACTLEKDPSVKARVTVINKNVPNMLGQITTVLADEKINIVDMLNKSRGDFAYNIFDLSAEPSDGALQKLQDISGIIKVRMIK